MKSSLDQFAPEQGFIKKYYYLWQGIGILGLILPFVLVFFVLIFGKNSFPAHNYTASISAIFYSNAGSLFIGVMFIVAFFLLNYSGFCRNEKILAFISGIAALGIIFFPCMVKNEIENFSSDFGEVLRVGLFHVPITISHGIHMFFASIFFLNLCLIAFFYFPYSEKILQYNVKKQKQRIVIYRLSGFFMMLAFIGNFAMVLILEKLVPPENYDVFAFENTFWGIIFEALMLIPFCISWLTKGNSLKDYYLSKEIAKI